ncbi:tetratricopeptide repeat protein [Estrella lausannensis]|uniref:Uncharacterized protein n=1 Tax=Estrella lausannensis TaxID=483423 RepID=A0A0H5E369_9BACT|nr:tetratricopeptide repeat protein [Estrella lausannensis]CRX37645.1 hypothetical protein ELAC_0284 [Estrella lausannensis]
MLSSIQKNCFCFLAAAAFLESTPFQEAGSNAPPIYVVGTTHSTKDSPLLSLQTGLSPLLNQIEESDLLGNFDEAQHLIDQLLEKQSAVPPPVKEYLFKKKLWLYFKQGNDFQVAALTKKEPPDDPFSLLMLSAALRNLDRYEEADAVLGKLLSKEEGQGDQVLLEKGNLLLKTKRYIEADSYFEEVLKSSTSSDAIENASIKRVIAAFLAQDQEKASAALDALQSRKLTDPLYRSLLFYLNAQEHMLRGNTSLALKSLKESVRQKIADDMLKPLLAEYGHYSIALALEKTGKESEELFSQADQAFLTLIALGSQEEGLIGRGKNLLAKKMSGAGKDEIEGQEQEIILSLLKLPSEKAGGLALLLQAESEGDFKKKNERFLILLAGAEKDKKSSLALLHGFHLIRWAITLNQEGFLEESKLRFRESAQALTLFMETYPESPLFAKAALSFVKAALGTKEHLPQARKILASLRDKDQPEQALAKAYEARIALENGDDNPAALANTALESYEAALKKNPDNPSLKEARFILASSLYQMEELKKAKALLLNGNQEKDLTPLLPEELNLLASIAENERSYDERAAYLAYIAERHKSHPLAKEAAFRRYTLKEYLSGGRLEIKHLEQFTSDWKDSPRIPLAYYLIGLDYKQDRKSPEGKWIRKKSLTKAIEAFTKASSSFHTLRQGKLIPQDQEESLTLLSFNAELETGLCNFLIAKESKAAKKEVYLEYAREIFARLVSELQPETNQLPSVFKGWFLYMDAKLLLAEAEMELGSPERGRGHLSDAMEYLRRAGIKQGYYFTKAHYLTAGLCIQDSQYEEAMNHLLLAEQDTTGFTTDEKLDGAIKMGICLKSLGRLDEAMNVFSSVVNADAVSSLRVQAMLERAYIYKEQNRLDLYRKQLEALERMGGKWQAKAQQLLEEQYGEHRHH